MGGKRKQRRCRICRKRPPWHYKNCPPGICKRCYHSRVWAERPAARRDRPAADPPPLPWIDQGDLDGDPFLDEFPDEFPEEFPDWFE